MFIIILFGSAVGYVSGERAFPCKQFSQRHKLASEQYAIARECCRARGLRQLTVAGCAGWRFRGGLACVRAFQLRLHSATISSDDAMVRPASTAVGG